MFLQYPGRDSQGLRLLPSDNHLLGCDDSCVPSSTNALVNSMWRSGEICQVLSTEAFTSFCHACDEIMGSSLPRHRSFFLPPHVEVDCTRCCPFMFCCLPKRLSSRCFPSSWPDTASLRSCLLLPPGFLETLEAGFGAGSRACRFFFVFPFALLNHGVPCHVCQLARMWTYEGPASLVILFFTHSATCLFPHSQFPII